MEIKIKKLTLRNFKGVRQAEYFLGGKNARIEGQNGSGKSTVFDAFTWLLFGKDHRDQTADTFELKTIDPATGEPYPREDHWVEAIITVDGMDHTLRRCWVENWVKPTGQIEDVLKGHSSVFFVDGVDVVTKRAYDAVVSGWLNEATFKLLTNPHYFIDDAFTGWKDRRKALLDLVKDAPERARVREEFADVVDKLLKRSIEDYRKQLAAEKAANKRDLAMTLSRIDGMREALPEEADTNAVNLRLDALRRERDEALAELKAQADDLDKGIASADEADAARKAENDAIYADLTRLQLRMSNCIAEAVKAAQDENNRAKTDAQQAWSEMNLTEQKINIMSNRVKREEADLGDLEKQRGRYAVELAQLGEKYKAEKNKAFVYRADTRCPYCGQEIPELSRNAAEQKAREDFVAMQKKALDELVGKAGQIKDSVRRLDETIVRSKGVIEEHKAEIAGDETRLAEQRAQYDRLKDVRLKDASEIEAEVRNSEDFRAMQRQEQELRSKAFRTSTRPDGLEELVSKRKEVEKWISSVKDRFAKAELEAKESLSIGKVRQEQLELIARKEQEAKSFADAIARDERDEARAAEFVKADIDSVEKAINGLFHTARWKMFDRTMDGGIVEMCEVTSPDGVPYRSMNDAMKIMCGLDCIRVFSERYGSTAPIFIDNAESITQEAFDTQAQVIRLVVKDIDKLTLIPE